MAAVRVDFLEAAAQGGRIILTPLQLSAKAPAPRLTPTEQRRLLRAKAKIRGTRPDTWQATDPSLAALTSRWGRWASSTWI